MVKQDICLLHRLEIKIENDNLNDEDTCLLVDIFANRVVFDSPFSGFDSIPADDKENDEKEDSTTNTSGF